MINEKETTRSPAVKTPHLTTAVLLLAILAGGAFLTWWTVAWTDRVMRTDLLLQTQSVAQTVDVNRVQTLSGTKADLTRPEYLQLKEQFAVLHSANPKYRFIYLMGRKPNGKVFFFVDSESSDSKDCSHPGQVYEEASDDLRRMFDTKTQLLEGPLTDDWGVWVSALVPMIDTKTGALVAVLLKYS